MTDRELMQQALEALELVTWTNNPPVNKAITAIREALAEQPAQIAGFDVVLDASMPPNTMKFVQPAQQQEPVAWLIWLHGPAGHFNHKQFAELEFERRNKEYPDPDRKLLPLYTSPPPQRTWVGLTDEEIDQGLLRSAYAFKTAEAWRAGVVFAMTKLKEKNT